MDIQQVKQRFGIIGNSEKFDRAIDIAMQVAFTDLSVLITGESGAGKERFPKIIHQYSSRKHAQYIVVNCGAIPEGTIDSELFGHEKGSFTGANETRKGYFEVADKGTIFLDEVAELPLSTQVRLLRVLESGEFYKVGSSKVQKTDIRVVAATNVNIVQAISEGKFREDLYYRLNTVPIKVPALRERKEDIHLLFRKFANDFAEKYKMPTLTLTPEAIKMLVEYRWRGNVRQLKNVTEQISIIETDRKITEDVLRAYLPMDESHNLPALYKSIDEKTFSSEREILYQILFDMKGDMNDLKKLVKELMQNNNIQNLSKSQSVLLNDYYDADVSGAENMKNFQEEFFNKKVNNNPNIQDTEIFVEESLSLNDKEKEMIIKALEKNKGKRKNAATELGISERTLYRKLKEYNIDI